MSKASDDLPEPDNPVITTSWSRGQIDVYVLEVVDARTAYRNPVVRHRYNSRICRKAKLLFYRRTIASDVPRRGNQG